MTSFFTKGNMDINAAHRSTKLMHILKPFFILLFLIFIKAEICAQSSAAGTAERKSAAIDSLHRLGFFEAQFNRLSQNRDSFLLDPGPRYRWLGLELFVDELPKENKRIAKLEGKYVNLAQLEGIVSEYIASNFHENGYPFAESRIEYRSIAHQEVVAHVKIQKNNLITFDSIAIANELIKEAYLSNYLNIKRGEPWSTEAYLSIQDKMEMLDVIKLEKAPMVSFARSKAYITLYAQKRRNNYFDALIGYTPVNGKNLITGQLDLGLANLFRKAVKTEVHWRRFDVSSQSLQLGLSQLRAFNSPLGFDLAFDLLKQDSSFISLKYHLLTNYLYKGKYRAQLGYQNLTNTSLRAQGEASSQNGDFRSSETHNLLVDFSYNSPMITAQLKNDLQLRFLYKVGSKTLKNYELLPIELQDLPENSTYQELMFSLSIQRKIFKRFLFDLRSNNHYLINPALSQNDLLRLGGLNDLRGFNQNFLFTPGYDLLNFNYRYFLNKQTNFFLLNDFAYLRDPNRWAYAFGLGLDVETKNGWFKIIYALGSLANESLRFEEAKIHIGYLAVF